MYYVKGLYELNLEGCPLDDDIAEVYPQGIVQIMAFYKNLMYRAIYRVNFLPPTNFTQPNFEIGKNRQMP